MISFTERQQKTIARGLTVLSVSLVAAFVAFLSWLALKALAYTSGAITPVIAGIFLAMFFRPYYHWWLKWVRNPTAAVLLMLLSVGIPLGLVLWLFGAFVTHQVSTLIDQAPTLLEKFVVWLHETFPNAREMIDRMGFPYESWLATYRVKAVQAGASALGCVMGLLNGIVVLVFFVYFLTRPDMRGEDCVKELPFLKDETKAFVAEQIDVFCEILVSFFQRQTVICLLEGVYYGAGFILVGLPYGFILGFALGVLNLVPLLGTVVCMPVALAIGYFGQGGSVLTVVLVSVVWGLGQILDGYIITPRIQGNKTGLGYAGVIFSFFFWGAVFQSLLGLLLAIPLSAFCVVLWRALKSKYIKPVV